jgi:magnesium chelatase family protein
VVVEVHVANGLPGFRVVGLPDASCRESRDRVRAAIVSSGLAWPQRRVTVNLAPSGIPKTGAGLDLAIALGVLAADGQLSPSTLRGMAFLGELGLDGALRRVPGTLPLVDAVSEAVVVVPASCAHEAALVRRARVNAAADLRSLVSTLRAGGTWPPLPPAPPLTLEGRSPDLADVRGQALGRQALEVAAAGEHHVLLVGAAGAGKTMLASRLPGLLPSLTPEEALEVAKIHSAAGLELPGSSLPLRPPFRAPHHSASAVSLIGGGGQRLRPGEVSCAHRGVLFLDELAEFPPAVLDNLRQPLEEGRVVVCRASAAVSFPARFLLVGAMNACRCGGDGSPGSCRCSDAARARYASRVSKPLLDRFDLRVRVPQPEVGALLAPRAAQGPLPPDEPTATVAARVAQARERARGRGVRANAELPPWRLDELAPLSPGARRLLERRLREGLLSARGLDRVRRVALTVADLAGHGGALNEEHVLMAVALRGPGALSAGSWYCESPEPAWRARGGRRAGSPLGPRVDQASATL